MTQEANMPTPAVRVQERGREIRGDRVVEEYNSAYPESG